MSFQRYFGRKTGMWSGVECGIWNVEDGWAVLLIELCVLRCRYEMSCGVCRDGSASFKSSKQGKGQSLSRRVIPKLDDQDRCNQIYNPHYIISSFLWTEGRAKAAYNIQSLPLGHLWLPISITLPALQRRTWLTRKYKIHPHFYISCSLQKGMGFV